MRITMGEIYSKMKIPLQSMLAMKNWYRFNTDTVTSKLGMFKGKNDVTTYDFRSGIKVRLLKKTTDCSTLNEIWFRRNYNPKGFEIQRNDIVVDIGAHKGFFTLYAMQFNPSQIMSFEPDPSNFSWLRDNVRLNAKDRPGTKVSLFNNAVYSEACKIPLYAGESTRTHSILKPPASAKSRRTVRVKCTTLSAIKEMALHIDFLKIDVEGAEYDIIFSDDLKGIGKIAMEFSDISGEKNQLTMQRYLKSAGFTTRAQKNMIYARRNL